MVDRYIKDVLPTKPKQIKDQGHQLRWWKEKTGSLLLADITPAVIVQFRDELGQNRSPGTVVRYMAALSHCFTIAVNEWQWLEDSPMRKVKKPKESRGRVRFLDDDERSRLLTACKKNHFSDWECLVVVYLYQNIRIKYIINIYYKLQPYRLLIISNARSFYPQCLCKVKNEHEILQGIYIRL